jgi:diaminopimelate epimerase
VIAFTKMHGIGNDFVMLDGVGSALPSVDFTELSRQMNDRRFGVGGDGLILVERGTTTPFRMRMFNPDGSESEMCGNGIRCFARLLKDRRYTDEPLVDVETGAGKLTVEVLPDGWVRVDMGPARLTRGEIPMTGLADEQFVDQPVSSEAGEFVGTAVSMGNPHLVIFVPDVQAVDLHRIGPILENNPLFPRRTNVHFASVVDRGHLIQRTWERGAGATLACGTGACAVGVAGYLTGRSDREVEIQLPGGKLRIEYREDGRVMMTGPAETVFEGNWNG